MFFLMQDDLPLDDELSASNDNLTEKSSKVHNTFFLINIYIYFVFSSVKFPINFFYFSNKHEHGKCLRV